MTEKQEKILSVALKLFAEEGFSNTSTSKIAKEAKVSEGLIFKHFKNKTGLLDAVVSQGTKGFERMFEEIASKKSPQEIVWGFIEMPYQILKKDPTFWKLQLSLKYQSPEIAERYKNSSTLQKAHELLNATFTELGREQPVMETQLLMQIVGGLFSSLPELPENERQQLVEFIKSKY